MKASAVNYSDQSSQSMYQESGLAHTPDPITMKSTSPVLQISSQVSLDTMKSLAVTSAGEGDCGA